MLPTGKCVSGGIHFISNIPRLKHREERKRVRDLEHMTCLTLLLSGLSILFRMAKIFYD